MGKPYADDLRLVVVRLIEEGHTRPEVAEFCGISLSSVGRYIRRYRTTGSVSPDQFGGYKDYAQAKYAERIKRWIAKQPDPDAAGSAGPACRNRGKGCCLVGIPLSAPSWVDV